MSALACASVTPGFHARHHQDEVEAVIDLLRLERERDIHLGLHAVCGAGSENADDGVLLSVHSDLLTDDGFVAAETVMPEAIAEDGFELFADLSFFGEKIAAEKNGLTEDVEELRSAGGRLDALRLRAGAEAQGAAGPCGDGLEGGVLALPVEEVTGGDAVVVAVDLGPDHDDAVGLVVGKGSEERGVDDAEDGGVGADAEGESEDGDGGEAGVFEEETEAEDEVAPTVAHGGSFVWPDERGTRFLLG